MTNEKMLQMLKEIGLENGVTNINAYMKLKQALEEDIRIEVQKKKGTKSSDIQIIKRIVKCEKENPMFGKYHTFSMNEKDYKCFLEGHYVVGSENDLGYKASENPFDLSKFFNMDMFDNIQLKVDIVDLKTFIKTNKTKKNEKFIPYIIKTEEIEIGFNPQFLLDTLEFCNTDTISVTTPIAPAFIKSENMDKIGLVLPIHINK